MFPPQRRPTQGASQPCFFGSDHNDSTIPSFAYLSVLGNLVLPQEAPLESTRDL